MMKEKVQSGEFLYYKRSIIQNQVKELCKRPGYIGVCC